MRQPALLPISDSLILKIWAVKQHFFNETTAAAIRCYSATKHTHIAFSGVFTSIRLP
jgi:hypothetical protein